MTRWHYTALILAASAAVLFIVFGVSETAEAPSGERNRAGIRAAPIEASAPTDFIQVGTLSFDAPGNRQDTPYLVYDEPGAPARSVELVMDPLSFCATDTGSAQCIAMSVSYSVPFGGKRAVVEGSRQADGSVLVRTLRIVSDDRIAQPSQAGRRFISWPAMESLIRSCSARSISQSHSLDVRIRLDDGTEYYSVEPRIDAVFVIVQDAGGQCGPVQLSTE